MLVSLSREREGVTPFTQLSTYIPLHELAIKRVIRQSVIVLEKGALMALVVGVVDDVEKNGVR